MKYTNESNMPGPGDSITWSNFNYHPNDPRHPGFPDDDYIMDCDCGWSGDFGDLKSLYCPECNSLLLDY